MKSEHRNAQGIIDSLSSVGDLQKKLTEMYKKWEKYKKDSKAKSALAIFSKFKGKKRNVIL